MFPILLILFIALPVLEIAVLLKVGGSIGGFNTIAFVIFTAIVGAYLVRQQGVSTIARVQAETNAGRLPAKEMAEGVLLLIAGAVLLTPGFITDAIGFSLLVPAVRSSLIKSLLQRMESQQSGFSYTVYEHQPGTQQKKDDSVIIDGSFRERD
ncbi:MAG: FxsA family protein [Pseudomonadota bacterium]